MDISQRNDVVLLVQTVRFIHHHIARWEHVTESIGSWPEDDLPPEDKAAGAVQKFKELCVAVEFAKKLARQVVFSPGRLNRPPRKSRTITELGEDLFLLSSVFNVYLSDPKHRALAEDCAARCKHAVKLARRETERRLRRAIARLECWLSWQQPIEGFLGISIDGHKVRRNGTEVDFGKKDYPFNLFAALFEATDSGLPRKTLVTAIWPDGGDNDLDQAAKPTRTILKKIGIGVLAAKGQWQLVELKNGQPAPQAKREEIEIPF